jgi:AraC-like DNA-binding protein
MDASYVSDLFKKKTGQTMTQFLQRIRVEASIRYLMDTRLTIQQIAEKCGFANDNYYIKVFKQWTGKTPGKFRH